ncbi:MAG: DUF6062 family protein [Lachnospiraceae bacterium]|nr:DUF6062 family protein [Lachnospiraceae bacterium]
MKEKLYTIPLNDAFNADDECPFCYIERSLEQNALDFVLGSGASYMESDIREATDNAGFCRHHLKMMYDYGNSLGNGLILKTHFKKLSAGLLKSFDGLKPSKHGLFAGKNKQEKNSVSEFINEQEKHCYICEYYRDIYERYVDTFFYLFDHDAGFKEKLKASKGFCVHHLGELLSRSEKGLSPAKQEELFSILKKLCEDNYARITEDITWFCDKFDYRNRDADWKNSKDAIPRTMQKITGGYPADDPYRA